MIKYYKQARRHDFHAETHIYPGFVSSIQRQQVAWIPNITLYGGAGRVGGPACPVIHDHSILHSCPNYFEGCGGRGQSTLSN